MTKPQPVLYIMSGLPGTGKTTLSQLLARQLAITHLRIDTIEQGLRDLCGLKVVAEGYRLSYRIAADNLRLGNSVIADSCNPILLSRQEWQQTARDAKATSVDIEIICSDTAEHQRRIATRKSTIPGLQLPTWQKVVTREYDPWTTDRILIDTADKTAAESLDELLTKLNLR